MEVEAGGHQTLATRRPKLRYKPPLGAIPDAEQAMQYERWALHTLGNAGSSPTRWRKLRFREFGDIFVIFSLCSWSFFGAIGKIQEHASRFFVCDELRGFPAQKCPAKPATKLASLDGSPAR
jgi:hypothetical protein